MAISTLVFDPVDGFEDSSVYTDPTTETEAREQLMSLHTQTQTYINTYVQPYVSLLESISVDDIEDIVDAVTGTNVSYTLSASDWSDNIYTITSDYITSASNQRITLVDPTTDQWNAVVAAQLVDGGQEDGTLYIKAMGTVPTVDIPINISYHGESDA